MSKTDQDNGIEEEADISKLSRHSQQSTQRNQVQNIDNDAKDTKGSITASREISQTVRSNYTKKHIQNESITLSEDCFGTFYDRDGGAKRVKRFTWKNQNNIQAQIITYGARITSIKLPNRKGVVDDIVLGFPDLAGYLCYSDLFFGATIGRYTNKLEGSAFAVEGKKFLVNANDGPHQTNGGVSGFDKVIWHAHVCGTKVFLTHTSPHLDEGYPGDLVVKIAFELTPRNEFKIDMTAVSSKPTIVSLSNLLYFNLGGHQSGPKELFKHTVSINANCYTVNLEDGSPSGEIMNVIHTKYDLMAPMSLKTCLGIEPNSGFDQNFCVNRGVDQGNCLVARATHADSGRILEIYSNQFGVNFSTANDFGTGLSSIPTSTSEILDRPSGSQENIFVLLDMIHEQMLQSTDLDEERNFHEVKDLVRKIRKCKFENESVVESDILNLVSEHAIVVINPDYNLDAVFHPLQLNYLRHIRELANSVHKDIKSAELKSVVTSILELCVSLDINIQPSEFGKDEVHELENDDKNDESQKDGTQRGITPVQTFQDSVEKISFEENKLNKEMSRKGMMKEANVIPSFYKDGKLHGKNGAIYKRHGAMAFQTQNYPDAIHHNNFPNCILRPGETYSHTIVYKFWIQNDNRSCWIRRKR